MAVIEKLRSKAGLLIGIVAFSLVAFVLGDFFSTNSGVLGGQGSTVGVIGGKKIDVQDFEYRVQNEIENYKLNQNVQTVDNNTTEQLREQTWSKVVSENVNGEQYRKLGLTVSADELADMIKGKNIHPQIRQAFTDPKTGVFNPSSVINFLKNMDNDPTGKTRRQWLLFERAIYDERLQQKYNDLIKNGLYVSTPETKEEYVNRNRAATLKYVLLNYNTIPDSTVQVSDAEIKAIYDKNLKKYKQEASRSIDYVVFDVQPSPADRTETLEGMKNLMEEFKTTENDSAFVAANSDEPFDNSFHKKGTMDYQIDSIINSAEVGTIAGPYERSGAFRLVKLIGVKVLPDSVQARHILLKLDGKNPVDVRNQADSLKNVLKNGGNFAILAMQYSTDDGSKIKGGDLGWFGPGMMVQPFNDACFEGKVGDMPIVESQFGIHLIEITGQKGGSRQVKVAAVTRTVQPSTKTYQQFFQKANDFASKYKTADDFDKGVKETNLTKLSEALLMENSRQIGSVENSRELVRWAFNGKKGEVSKAFEFGNKFVVAKITGIKEKGYSTVDEIKDQLVAEAKKDKKAEMLIEKIKKAGNVTTIDELAQKLQQTAQEANNFGFSTPFLANAGAEPLLAGISTTLKPGKISQPVKGQAGVYVVAVTSFTEPAATNDYKDLKNQLNQQVQQRALYEVPNALREKAEIEDNRGKFY